MASIHFITFYFKNTLRRFCSTFSCYFCPFWLSVNYCLWWICFIDWNMSQSESKIKFMEYFMEWLVTFLLEMFFRFSCETLFCEISCNLWLCGLIIWRIMNCAKLSGAKICLGDDLKNILIFCILWKGLSFDDFSFYVNDPKILSIFY